MPQTVELCKKLYNIPLFDELTIKHLIDLRRTDLTKPVEVLKWGLGKKVELIDTPTTVLAVANTLTLIQNLIQEVRDWMQSAEKVEIPKTVDIMGVVVNINPGLIQQLPYWGTVRCKAIINTVKIPEGKAPDYTDYYPEIIAHYLYAKVTKSEYYEDKADEFIEIIHEMNMKEAIQLGNFFLLKQSRLFQNRRGYLLTRLIVTRKRLALKISRFLGTLMFWKR